MPRIARVAPGGVVYHVLNRGNGRRTIFHKDADAAAFVDLLAETKRLFPMRILGYCVMGNHWHTVLWPANDGDLARFMGRLTTTHVRRYFLHYHDQAGGHLYQGRYKNFPVESDSSLLRVLRYVEANPLRAGLVGLAEQWRWSSLWHFARGRRDPLVDEWPLERPADWLTWVNRPPPEEELNRLRTSLNRGRPYGGEDWVTRMCRELGLEFTLRGRGRPPRPHADDIVGLSGG